MILNQHPAVDFPKHLVYTGNTLVLEPVNNSIRSMEQAEGGGGFAQLAITFQAVKDCFERIAKQSKWLFTRRCINDSDFAVWSAVWPTRTFVETWANGGLLWAAIHFPNSGRMNFMN